MDYNAMCRSSCIEHFASCGSGPGDTVLTCFTGSFFVGDDQRCTRQYRTQTYKCVQPRSLSFCNSTFVKHTVLSSATLDSAQFVHNAMDNVTERRYKSYASANITSECKFWIQSHLCMINFSPCKEQIEQPVVATADMVKDPREALQTTCANMQRTCPPKMHASLCTFDTPVAPDPSKCIPPGQ